jgi:hypothetical protein
LIAEPGQPEAAAAIVEQSTASFSNTGMRSAAKAWRTPVRSYHQS